MQTETMRMVFVLVTLAAGLLVTTPAKAEFRLVTATGLDRGGVTPSSPTRQIFLESAACLNPIDTIIWRDAVIGLTQEVAGNRTITKRYTLEARIGHVMQFYEANGNAGRPRHDLGSNFPDCVRVNASRSVHIDTIEDQFGEAMACIRWEVVSQFRSLCPNSNLRMS